MLPTSLLLIAMTVQPWHAGTHSFGRSTDELTALLADRETQNPDGKPGMRADLAAAVNRLGPKKVATPLRIFDESKDDEVRRGASFVLSEIGDRDAVPILLNDYLSRRQSVVQERDLGKFDDPQIVSAYIEMLESEDEDDRQRASTAMIYLRAKSAIPLLTPLVTHEKILMRARAVEGLGAIGDASAVPALITALNDTNDGVVIYAAKALGGIGDERAIDPIKKRLAKGGSDFFTTQILRQAINDIREKAKTSKNAKP